MQGGDVPEQLQLDEGIRGQTCLSRSDDVSLRLQEAIAFITLAKVDLSAGPCCDALFSFIWPMAW